LREKGRPWASDVLGQVVRVSCIHKGSLPPRPPASVSFLFAEEVPHPPSQNGLQTEVEAKGLS
jgi:hypothetical protein